MAAATEKTASRPTTGGTWAEQARRERTQEATRRRRARSRARWLGVGPRLFDTGVVLVLLVLAALAHGAVFGGTSGYVAALGGVAVGALAALSAARFHLRAPLTIVTVLLSYLLFGGVLALPGTALARVVPTPRTLQLLVVGVVTSWKDLLTVQPPAGSFTGPAVMPYLAAVLSAAAAMTITARTHRPLWAILPATVLLLLGIMWGSQSAPLAVPSGVLFGVLALSWAGAVSARRRREGGRGTVEFVGTGRRPRRRRLIGATAMVALGALAASTLTPALVADGHRAVLRDLIEPPLDMREYHSPISMFRSLNTDGADADQLTVSGLPKGARIRLATLDTYDGTVFRVAGTAQEAGFRHVGTQFTDTPLPAGTGTSKVTVTIGDLTGNWVPSAGATRSLDFSSSRAAALGDGIYYSDTLTTILSTTALAKGDSFAVEVTDGRQWSDRELEGKAFMRVTLPQDTNVPSSVAEVASTMVADATPGIGQVRAIQQKLHDDGFYSDGSDGLSLPGHRADRLEKFLTDAQMVGDDDQYAPAMALLLRSLGIPARVVMGFYPDDQGGGDITLTGKNTHVWVEVAFDGAGWVAFDPTPPRDQVPQTQVPKPKPNPKPQVLQPPDPPEQPAEVPPDSVEQPQDNPEPGAPWWERFIVALEVTGIVLLLLSPFAAIVAAKARRASKRRRRGAMDVRAAAAWEEVVDRATDLGVRVPPGTRSDQARIIDSHLSGHVVEAPAAPFMRWDEPRSGTLALATRLDGAVFGEGTVDESTRERAWNSGSEVIASMRRQVSGLRRLRATFSTRSLRARRHRMGDRWRAWRVARAGRRREVVGTGTDEGATAHEGVRSGNG